MSISSQIIEVINDLCAKFGIVIDWTADNVVPYIEELVGKYISWEVATSKMWIAIGIGMVVVGIVLMLIEFVTWKTDGVSYILLVPLAIAGGSCHRNSSLRHSYMCSFSRKASA